MLPCGVQGIVQFKVCYIVGAGRLTFSHVGISPSRAGWLDESFAGENGVCRLGVLHGR